MLFVLTYLLLSVQDKNKPIIFSMARLDKVKNLTGLASWFAGNEKLQKLVNLVIVGGIVDPSQSSDKEEKAQCEKVLLIITFNYNLYKSFQSDFAF